MADPPAYPTADGGTHESDRASTTRGSRWLAVAAIVLAIMLVVIFVFLHLAGVLGPGAHQDGS